MNRKKVLIASIVLLFLVIMNIPFLATAIIEGKAKNRIFDVDSAPQKPVALVLGAAAYNPYNLSSILEDRMDTAIELYWGGKAQKLILSGATNEVIAMANHAVNKGGIPQMDIMGDQNGYNTFASVADIADNYPSMTIVTQRYHLPRALFYAEHLGVDAVGVSADKRAYDKITDFKKRERLAQVKAFLDVYLLSWLLSDEGHMKINAQLDELG